MNPSAEAIQAWLVEQLAERLAVDAAAIDVRRPFEEYGLGSRQAVMLSGDLEEWLGRPVQATLVWEYPSIEAVAGYLAQGAKEVAQAPAGGSRRGVENAVGPVAIVGIGCRFPGAEGPEAFWRLLTEGVDAISEVPPDRWDAEGLYDPEGLAPGKMNTRWGGFLEQVDQFDHGFFGISPREAARMDPQQRLLLEVAWEALEDAGIPAERLVGSSSGVFVGISSNDYAALQLQELELVDAYAGTGNAHSVAANRLSYLLDLRGPSLAVDTACSSSLVAVHLACQSLQQGECELALAGGVNVILSPALTVNFSKAGVMAADGRSKAFDAGADGYVRGEGAGVVILKPLERALADGDRVYAVLLGSAVNQDGRSNGLMAPNPQAQEAVLREAYRRAGVNPGQVQYVETHGTGTFLGDPIEAGALGRVLAQGRAPGERCRIGSVKSNIGHLEAAAGVAGLIKAALALQRRTLPASLHFHEANPNIDFERLPLAVQTALSPWPVPTGAPLLAGVSSFGFGGTNAHVVLCDIPPAEQVAEESSATMASQWLLPLSARSPEALQALAGRYGGFLRQSEAPLAAIMHGAALRRSHHDERLALVGADREGLVEALEAVAAGHAHGRVVQGRRQGRSPLVFVFPGQGGQWTGMARDLLAEEPAFREALARCEAALASHLSWSVTEVLQAQDEAALLRIDLIQPLLFALQVSLAALWDSWGVRPEAVVGHSMGEVAAACVAGALSLEDGARVICERSSLMAQLAGQGAMLLVGLAPEEAARWLDGHREQVAIAVHNSPRSTVLSGAPEALQQIAAALPKDVFQQFVKVDVAAHSPQMDGLQGPLAEALAGLQPKANGIAIYSTVTGGTIEGTMMDAGYWMRNLREPVRFADAVQQLAADGFQTFVEISPHPILLTAIQQGVGGAALALPSLRREAPGGETMRLGLGTLYTRGREVAWEQIYPATAGGPVPLPGYPWQRQRHWLDGPRPWEKGQAGQRERAVVAGADRDWFYTVRWEEQALPEPEHGDGRPAGAYWLLFADNSGVGALLERRLRESGYECLVVGRGANYRAPAAGEVGRYELDPGVKEHFEQLLQAEGRAPAAVVYLWGLDAQEDGVEAAGLTAAGPLHLLQALAEARWSEMPRLWLATRQAQRAGEGQGIVQPAQALLWGLGRTVAHELPRMRCSLLDVAVGETESGEIEEMVRELLADGAETQVALRGERRYVARLTRMQLGMNGQRASVRADGTYLISGGLGGLGLLVARWLVEQGARHLVLLGRSEGSAAAQAEVERLRAADAGRPRQIEVAQVDVAQEEALAGLLERVRTEMPPLRGLIHAAAVLEDGLLLEQTWSRFQQVFPPKVLGARNLHRLTQGDPLDFFVLFSSVASLLGSPGQGNYAAANAYLDGLAAERRRQGQPGLSINWGPWAEVGLAASDTLARRFGRWGLGMIEPQAGLEALGQLLALGEGAPPTGSVMVLEMEWSRAVALFPSGEGAPFLSRLAPPLAPRVASEPPVQGASGEARKDGGDMQGYLRRLLAHVLQVAPEQIPAEGSLLSLGLDSIMTMELMRRVEQDLGLHLYPREILERPVLAELAAYLEGERRQATAKRGPEKTGRGNDEGRQPVTRAVAATPAAAAPKEAVATLATLTRRRQPPPKPPTQRNPTMAFLLSAPRSGSTLLRVMLAGHRQLFAPPELHLLSFDRMDEWRAGLGLTYVGEGVEIAFKNLLGLDADGSRAYVEELAQGARPVQEVYRLLQEAAAPRLLVDKSPSYGGSPETLEQAEQLFERPRYIFLTRHPYSVIESMVRMRFERLLGAGDVDPYALAEQVWSTINSNIVDFLAEVDPARWLVVRYEELVRDPPAVMTELCDFLQIPFDEAVLRPYQGERMAGGLYEGSLPIGDPNFARYGKIDPARAESWRRVSLPRRLGGVARRVSEELGYELPIPLVSGGPALTREEAVALATLQPEGVLPPLILVHPGGGTVFFYYELAEALGTARPVYGINDLSLDGKRQPPPSVAAYAANYVELVRRVQPQGPYYLGGWSFGGHVAMEMAQLLRDAGEEVPLLLMIDTEAPVAGRRLSLRQRLAFFKNRLVENLAGAPELLPYVRDALYLVMTHQGRQQRAREQMGMVEYFRWAWRDAFRRQLEANAPMARRLAEREGFGEVELPGTSVRRGLWLLRHHMKLANQYRPRQYAGSLTFLRAQEQVARKYFKDDTLGWRPLIQGTVTVHHVPGNHVSLFREPHVYEVAEVIRGCLARLEQSEREEEDSA